MEDFPSIPPFPKNYQTSKGGLDKKVLRSYGDEVSDWAEEVIQNTDGPGKKELIKELAAFKAALQNVMSGEGQAEAPAGGASAGGGGGGAAAGGGGDSKPAPPPPSAGAKNI